MIKSDLMDSYTPVNYNIKPLAILHIIKEHKPKSMRYDYIFVNNEWNVKCMQYLYKESILAGSNHTMLISDLVLYIKAQSLLRKIGSVD